MAEHSVTVENTLKTLLEEKKYSTLKDILITVNPADIAETYKQNSDHSFPFHGKGLLIRYGVILSCFGGLRNTEAD